VLAEPVSSVSSIVERCNMLRIDLERFVEEVDGVSESTHENRGRAAFVECRGRRGPQLKIERKVRERLVASIARKERIAAKKQRSWQCGMELESLGGVVNGILISV